MFGDYVDSGPFLRSSGCGHTHASQLRCPHLPGHKSLDPSTSDTPPRFGQARLLDESDYQGSWVRTLPTHCCKTLLSGPCSEAAGARPNRHGPLRAKLHQQGAHAHEAIDAMLTTASATQMGVPQALKQATSTQTGLSQAASSKARAKRASKLASRKGHQSTEASATSKPREHPTTEHAMQANCASIKRKTRDAKRAANPNASLARDKLGRPLSVRMNSTALANPTSPHESRRQS